MSLVNKVVALSNIYGLVPIYKFAMVGRYVEALATCVMVAASFMMHISETKHHLPGVYLTQYSDHLLWFDRMVANAFSVYIMHRVYQDPSIVSIGFLLNCIAGLSLIIISEMLFTTESTQVFFMISHSLWHYIAYVHIISSIATPR